MGLIFRGLQRTPETMVRWSPPREITPPVEPIVLEDAKLTLKVDTDYYDTLIAQRLVAARKKWEADTSTWVARATYDLAFDVFPSDGVLVLPYGPVAEVVSLTIYDLDDAATVVDADFYLVDLDSHPPRLFLDYDTDPAWWPSTDARSYRAGVLRVIGGPEETSEGSDVAKPSPEIAVEAIYQLLTHWHYRIVDPPEPPSYRFLVEQHRIVGVV